MLCIDPLSLISPEALLFALFLVNLPGCRIPEDPEERELVTDFRFSPEAFDSFTGTTSLRYTLRRPATTTIRILAPGKSPRLIMTLFEELNESGGVHQHTWLGDTEEGYFAGAGEYVGELEAEGEVFQAVVRIYHR